MFVDADDTGADETDWDAGDQPDEGYGFEPYDQEGESLLGGDEPPVAAPGPPAPPARETSPLPEVPAAPLALYRRYRPDTFAQVIGQEHVTDPLQRALTNNRVNHAYLFSGPRGCGKTTSARILARCLNCIEGPTPTPCGECQSCRDLARGGPGSIDVIEIDAASHGGVDDARDLRERAFFAPVHSRYKIYIVDEAHMVTTAGFNAMLKLVEEPPPHVKFVFATTEPEKVIGTIRSRTHHYPFRLVPPRTLQNYLAELCEAEGIAVEPTVLPLVVRAGAGSVRDSLSVLDQLLGGAAESGVSYEQAAALLGYTPESLLDEIVDAFAAGDAAGVFACIDKVMEVGQDPRRFGEDLLRRLRDLVIVSAVPDAIASGLVDVAGDQAERLLTQAGALGRGELTRAAEVIATGLTDMRGTTAPRLHLELMCARVLLPGADVDERGFHARLDRLERRLAGVPTAPAADVAAPDRVEGHTAEVAAAPDRPVHHEAAGAPAAAAMPPRLQERPAPPHGSPPGGPPAPQHGSPQRTPPAPPTQPQPVEQPPAAAAGPGLKVADVRRLWPDVLDEVKTRRRFTWILISQNAQVADVHDGVLTLAMKNEGARDHFAKGGNEDVLRDAIVEVLRVNLRIQTMVDGSQPPAQRTPAPQVSTDRVAAPHPPPAPPPPAPATPEPPRQAEARSPEPPQDPPAAPSPAAERSAAALARDRIMPTRGQTSDEPPPEDEPSYDPYDDIDDGEADADPHVLLTKHLGAEQIAEESDSGG